MTFDPQRGLELLRIGSAARMPFSAKVSAKRSNMSLKAEAVFWSCRKQDGERASSISSPPSCYVSKAVGRPC
jgi:hypothetical protein